MGWPKMEWTKAEANVKDLLSKVYRPKMIAYVKIMQRHQPDRVQQQRMVTSLLHAVDFVLCEPLTYLTYRVPNKRCLLKIASTVLHDDFAKCM